MIDVEQLRKHYNGTQALNGFSLHVERGELFGLVGPNGAGKTTLMKVLATLVLPDGGSARIDGLDVQRAPTAVKPIIGFMPEQPGLYQEMSVCEFLEFFADAFRLKDRRRAAIEGALELSGLRDRRDVYVEALSFGMRQRLMLAKTLLHGPRVLLLDEPATGLDPIARMELRTQLKALNAAGVTILISSHILSDLEDICTQVALIAEGRNASDDTGRTVIPLHPAAAPTRLYQVEVLDNAATATTALGRVPGARLVDAPAVEGDRTRLLVEVTGGDREAAAMLAQLVSSGLPIVRFDRRTIGLEEQYRRAFQPRDLDGGGR